MPTEREKQQEELLIKLHDAGIHGTSLEELERIADYILANYDPKGGVQTVHTPKPAVVGDGELRFQIMDYLDEHDDLCASDLAMGIMQLFASHSAATQERATDQTYTKSEIDANKSLGWFEHAGIVFQIIKIGESARIVGRLAARPKEQRRGDGENA